MKVLFFDLDGTLMCDGDFLSTDCISELERVRAAGNKLVLNTGRGLAFVPERIKKLPLWDGMICGCSYVSFQGEILENKTLSREILESVYNWAREQNTSVLFEGVTEYFSTNGKGQNAAEMFERDTLPQITKVTFWCDPKKVKQEDFPGLRIIHFSGYSEGILSGRDKSTGMKAVLEKLNLTKEDAWGFGDSENDFDMLAFAGKGICMAGAPENFDGICYYRCKSRDGVPEALKKFF